MGYDFKTQTFSRADTGLTGCKIIFKKNPNFTRNKRWTMDDGQNVFEDLVKQM